MNRLLLAAIAATTFCAGPVMAQSAKFAAGWDTAPVSATSNDSCVYDPLLDSSICTDNPDGTNVTMLLATLKIPQGKEVLVSVSAETLIHLITEAKGGRKNVSDVTENFSSRALAQGDVEVTLSLVATNGSTCGIAPDSNVTLASEMRELTVSGGGDMTMLTDEDFWIEVGIETASKGAHHFEFLGVNCDQGDYSLTATFDLTAITKASGYDSNAVATVTLYDRMVTMQEVRAVKGSLVSGD